MQNKRKLIDANALKAALRTKEGAAALGNSAYKLFKVDKIIDAQPTVDAVEVVHGRWVDDGWGDWRCSYCHHLYSFDDLGDIHPLDDCGFNYCPNCGAKMEG